MSDEVSPSWRSREALVFRKILIKVNYAFLKVSPPFLPYLLFSFLTQKLILLLAGLLAQNQKIKLTLLEQIMTR